MTLFLAWSVGRGELEWAGIFQSFLFPISNPRGFLLSYDYRSFSGRVYQPNLEKKVNTPINIMLYLKPEFSYT